jgi:aspartyl-tRNA(Asn)/glutamyl-tRNA(Gln) amidotransferase subunit A
MTDLALESCGRLIELYRAKKASPVEVLAAVAKRIERQNPTLNAFAHLDLEYAHDRARESEARWVKGRPQGLLDGLPVSVKDLGLVRGMPTLRGSLSIDRRGPWLEDAPSVARAREQGAVLIGKTAVPEFGCKGTTDSRLQGVTCNPWNPEMTPGGSSGGAVAAVASGMSCADIASDAGGSIRNPCAMSGVVGLKPSFGRVPDYPPSPIGSMAVIGPICRTVRDAALFMNVLSVADPRDPGSKPLDGEDFLAGVEEDVRGLSIAMSPTLGYARLDGEVLESFEHAVAALKLRSIERVEAVFSDPAPLVGTFLSVGLARVYRALGPARARDDQMDPAFIAAVRRGEQLTLQEYLDAVAARKQLIANTQHLFQRYDLLLTPMLPVAAFPVGMDDPPGNKLWKPFSGWVNLAKLPAASVPCGTTKKGLPIGLQIVGPRFSEAKVLRMARAVEKACGFERPDLAERISVKAELQRQS